MLRLNQLTLPAHADDDVLVVKQGLAHKYGLQAEDLRSLRIVKKSLDARRKRFLKFHYKVDLELADEQRLLAQSSDFCEIAPKDAKNPIADLGALRQARHRPIIIGSGPAGMFAGNVMALAGQPAVIIERGDGVERRIRRVNRLRSRGLLDPESHYCYGEGGAGTFSDGKLTCGRNHPLVQYVFEQLVAHGAPGEILFDAHPHVGTDYLLKVAMTMRKNLSAAVGTTMRFRERFVGFRSGGTQARYLVQLASGEELPTDHLVIAIGHSARETYRYLYDSGLEMVQKPFAIGVRLEHRQETINRLQYGSCDFLPAAEYKLAAQAGPRGIWTFCMCPGGILLPTTAEPGHLAINGMSYHARNSGFANAAIVVNIRREDYDRGHPLDGIAFQRSLERKAFAAGGGDYCSPAQKLTDFLQGRPSRGELPSTYRPGVRAARMDHLLPEYVVTGLKQAMTDFDNKIKGFIDPQALVVGLESKTSAPVSMPRDGRLQSTSHPGLFPCGEGAGFAGGIVSAALDGVRVGRAVLSSLAEEA